MFASPGTIGTTKTTSYKVVLPFYAYAAAAFLVATFLLLLSASEIPKHYFQPHTIAITHIMSLGWGTMMILGASHQLVPVMVESKLHSNILAYASFVSAAAGIPLLVFGIYTFNMGWPAQWGGILIMMAIIAYLINLAMSMSASKSENVQAVFVFTAAIWLLATATLGLMLVYNFTFPFLSNNSIDYLSLHAHIGIAGWFLLLVMGVGSRLIPMFLISKYDSSQKLWWIYGLLNVGLLTFVFIFLYTHSRILFIIPLVCISAAIIIFGNFCYLAYRQRIRKKVDEQMKISLLSVILMVLPIIFLIVIITLLLLSRVEQTRLIISYGFIIFFGWITAIILGMTFKTLPFIIWNKVYHQLAGKGRTPTPKDLFSDVIFRWMSIAYLGGFVIFTAAILSDQKLLLQLGALLLLITSVLYNWNVIKLFMHKSVSS